MNSHKIHAINTSDFFSILVNKTKILAITFAIALMIISDLFSQIYYVSPNATGSGNGTINNPWSIYQAASNASAGDSVFIRKGEYNIDVSNGSVLTFANSGTASNPIVFKGEYDGTNPKTVDGTLSTYIKCAHTTNGNIKINGNYIKFYNMVIEQAVNTNGGVQQAINVSGDNVTIDSCVIREPSGISGEHTIIVKPSAQYFTLRNSYLWNSGRTFIWIEASATDAAHYSLMENNIFTGMDNHYAFQIMPLTNVSNPPNNIGAVIRNNLFIDIPYSSAVYLRNTQDFKIYNNVFIRAGGLYGSPLNIQTHESAPFDTLDANGMIAYNTYIADSYGGGAQEFVHHIGNMNNVKLYNNLCVFSSVKYVYRTAAAYNTIAAGKRWQSDYNLFYAVDDPNWTGTKNSVWYNYTSGVSTTTYSWAQTKSVLGFDANTIVGVLPTFVNSSSDFRPLNTSSPQVGEGTDLSSWGITTDFDGNPRDPNNPTIGAFEYVTGGVDVTPPNLVGAVLNSTTSLRLSFSEQLNSSAAQNISNYTINNGITVTGASVSGSQVTLTTSVHISGNYVVTVNNVTDLNGNIINPNQNTAAYNYTPGDVTPPNLLGAVLNNPTSLTLNFSEQLNSSTAQSISNYTINNGISITAASVTGLQVTLTTSAHSPGNYSVTVNNVTDIAGNVINPSNNSAAYNYSIVDITPPQVVSAAIIDSVKLNVYFSENLDPNTAQDINNYNIAGINITSVVLNSNIVTLSTSVHSNGTYNVIVSNVKDLAGNIIDPQQNSAIYEYASSVPGQMKLPVSGILESVVPEPQHNGEKTIDGNGFYQGDPDSRWAGDTMPEWLVYDLGDVQIINQTKLSFYNWNTGRIYNYSLQISSDSIQWSNVRTNIESALEEWSIEDIGPVEARYIKVLFVANNQNAWAGLWESEFLGHLKVPTNIEDDEITPTSFVLEQNYPNPFNPSTKIKFSLPSASNVRLTVYNTLGELIMTLAEGNYEAGSYDIEFSALGISSGIYFYRIEAGNFAETKKMIVMK